jgi:hypothetical protein
MTADDVIALIKALPPEEQAIVCEFVLGGKDAPTLEIPAAPVAIDGQGLPTESSRSVPETLRASDPRAGEQPKKS